MSNINNEVLKQLRDEIIALQGRRHSFILRKLSFTVALMGIGSVNLPPTHFIYILYLVPVVALVFDIYILIEDYRIKRIAEFLRQHGPSLWEEWVRSYPNRLAPFAAPLVTYIILVSAAMVMWPDEKCKIFYWLWFIIIIIVNGFLLFRSIGTRRRFKKIKK